MRVRDGQAARQNEVINAFQPCRKTLKRERKRGREKN